MISKVEFENPPVKYRVKPFWFWNGEITKEEITYQIEEMRNKGLGGAFICARQGMTVPYLSKEWFQLVTYACEEAKRCGLETWLYDEYPYPSGMSGGEVLLEHPEAEHKVLQHKTICTSGNIMIEEELRWGKILHAKAYAIVGGTTDWKHSINLENSIGVLQTEKIYQQTGLTKYNRKRFFSYGPKKILKDTLPKGEWRIEIYWETAMGDFKYYGGFLDPCNANAVKTFLNTTHERYEAALGNQFGDSVLGMFSDEVGLLSPIPWSSLLPSAFEKRNGYSLISVLPALHDDSIEHAMKIRYDLYQTAHELFVESYHKQVSTWCQENHLFYATEVPSMRMGTQRYSDIVGGDTAHEKLGRSLEWIYDEYLRHYRSNAKAVSSLARQLNKSYAMIESFHSVGWSMTLQDAKWMLDRLGSSGINFYNFHAFYYTIQDITKHDAPPSQFLQNPYWKHYRKLSDYAGRMSMLVSNTEADIQIAVLDPVAAMWTRLGNPFSGFAYKGESKEEQKVCDHLRDQWVRVCKTILFHQMDYDHLDSEILKEASVRDGKLHLGKAAYSMIVLPPCHCMEDDIKAKLHEFMEMGGRVIGLEMLPHQSISEATDDEIAAGWKELFEMEMATFLPTANWEEEFIEILKKYIPRTVQVEVKEGNKKDVIISTRVDESGLPFVFVVNQGKEKVVIRIQTKVRNVAAYDLETGGIYPMSGNGEELFIFLNAYESRWIKLEEFSLDGFEEANAELNCIKIPMQGDWAISLAEENICRFGMVEMSLDGENWGETEPKTFVEQCSEVRLLEGNKITFDGEFGLPRITTPSYPLNCHYRMEFYIEDTPNYLGLLLDRETIAGKYEIFVNNILVPAKTFVSIRRHDQNNITAPITSMLCRGKNVIDVKVLVKKAEEGLRDPLYISGEFGVTSMETEGRRMPCLIRQPSKACPDAHWYQGFPYYSGEITFTKKFENNIIKQEKAPFTIQLDFNIPSYECMEVFLNGHSLGVKAYTPYLWKCCPEWVEDGENEISVKITNTLVNLLEGTYFDYSSHRLVEIEL